MTNEQAINRLKHTVKYLDTIEWRESFNLSMKALEKQIPKKVEWTIDRSWGIHRRQPVCPVCDYYLTPFEFIGEKGRKVTYCEICGQAIDWSK